MLKKLFFASTVGLAAIGMRADTLYWQVAEAGEFSAATLYASNSENARISLGTDSSYLADGVDFENNTLTGTSTGLVQTDISSYANDTYSFFVELVTYSSAEDTTGTTKSLQTWSYSGLVSSGYVSSGGNTVPSFASGGGLNMTPEPTSGMMLLVGGSLLALRRRRPRA